MSTTCGETTASVFTSKSVPRQPKDAAPMQALRPVHRRVLMFHGSFTDVTYRRDLALKRLHGSISRLAKTLVEIGKLEAYQECNAYSICAPLSRLCTCNSELTMHVNGPRALSGMQCISNFNLHTLRNDSRLQLKPVPRIRNGMRFGITNLESLQNEIRLSSRVT